MTQEFVTLPREVVERVRGALAYVGVGNAFENPNLAQSTCKQAIWKLDHALRAALEQPQGEQEPVAWIENVEGGVGYNPYHEAARKLPDGVRFDLYTHPQNLRCKSNQKRLATLWGYVKEQPKREPLTDEQVPSPTAGMNIAQRILHVGGRNNAAGYVEFGGIQAVEALVLQVLRDLPRQHEPQGEQEPVAVVDFTTEGWRKIVDALRTLPDGAQLYTQPQQQREPLTREKIRAIQHELSDTVGCSYETMTRAVEAAHNIK